MGGNIPAVGEFGDPRDGGLRGELRVDGYIPEFVLEKTEFVGGRELWEEREEEGGFSGAEEAGEDGDGDWGGHCCVCG